MRDIIKFINSFQVRPVHTKSKYEQEQCLIKKQYVIPCQLKERLTIAKNNELWWLLVGMICCGIAIKGFYKETI